MTDTETPPQLFAAREPIFPRRVSGPFRSLKWWILGITLAIYYITPWLRWDRGPNLPDQAVLVDLANRRFFFFWIEIWPHEFYFVAGLLIMAGLGLFLFTSALGRVWCGYTCPQTVWTDLFILVERWIEGDRNARVRLWRQGYDAKKLALRLTKWTVWLLIAVATGGAWVFYFADAPTLLRDIIALEAAPVAYASIGILTATTFIFGGFLREQVCIYMCPWPRIQAAMMDEETLTVAYRDHRGEPRGKKHENTTGDCIDCIACVNVCPMGIDIRDGQQLECITCALCIDACDDVMEKIGKPRGLIDYCTLADEGAVAQGARPTPVWRHVVRPRTVLYSTLWAAVGAGLLVALLLRSDVELSVSPLRNPTFVVLSDGAVRNIYDVRLRNKTAEERAFVLWTEAGGPFSIALEGAEAAVLTVPADTAVTRRLYLTAPAGAAPSGTARTEVRIWLEAMDGEDRIHADSFFTGRTP
ncbi:MAG: cytochrome c oxidase accessory protein CcoG [Pseudomonadota bacterium]